MKLVLHPDARADFDELIDFIADRAGGRVADLQLSRALAALETIQQFPRTSRYDKKLDVFETWLPRTRFIAFYRILEAEDLIVVLAIIDHARNTSRTKRRMITARG